MFIVHCSPLIHLDSVVMEHMDPFFLDVGVLYLQTFSTAVMSIVMVKMASSQLLLYFKEEVVV